MRGRFCLWVGLAVVLTGSVDSAWASRPLSFDQRVAAQRAIESVYHAHTNGARTPFETAVPLELLESKVRRYLRQSAALEGSWNTPITAEMLDRELERIARGTRFPDRLEEVFGALGNDPFLIRECFARASLADRMSQSLLGTDRWSSWWQDSRGWFDETSVDTVAGDRPLPDGGGETARSICLPDDTWRGGTFDNLEERDNHTSVWTGSLMLVWGGQSGSTVLDTGHRYDPLIDSWTPMTTTNAPAPRVRHTAVWTGTEMVVWGGWTGAVTNSGGRYDPATDSWFTPTTTNAPVGRENHTAVWTGTRMVVWGGRAGSPLNSGGRYDPASDSWTATTATNAPTARQWHAATWTGSHMVVWGGWNSSPTDSGGRYDPVSDSWSTMTTIGAPQARRSHTVVWTGDRVVVWGGQDASTAVLENGGRYDPAADSWTSTSTSGAPEGRSGHTAVWTGNEMLVWGGSGLPGPLNSGGRYDPTSDSWALTSLVDAPAGRIGHSAVWTGNGMIVWGGKIVTRLRSGGRYDPVTDSWTPTAPAVPTGRAGHTAVWTGNRMIVWGGSNANFGFEQTGGSYDALLDSWTATSLTGVPQGRAGHTAVWTGVHMVVWGGTTGEPTRPVTGGRYNPVNDRWMPTSTVDAPPGRVFHTAVWTGDEMVVWGGFPDLQSGGRYDPIADSWAPTTTSGAPIGRYWHTAVWADDEMLVWGGYDNPNFLADGRRYDPATDGWSAISTMNAPAGRAQHTATWTGSRMVVWGGNDLSIAGTGSRFDTGGIYNPTNDKWTVMSTVGAPVGRDLHSAVWTGNEVVFWGGQTGPAFTPVDVESGGRFDVSGNAWIAATSTVAAPSARRNHTGVWTGSDVLVWAGESGPPAGPVNNPRSWGKYALGHATDDDGDGVSECDGDCDDANDTIFPGAPELCDNRDNDCDGSLPPDEVDGDNDGSPLCADCDDADPTSYPNAPELCDNVDNDCDLVVDEIATTCGLGECVSTGFCSGGADSCQPGTPSNETCDGLDNDCDGVVPVDELDTDADGLSTCEGDCDDGNPQTYPGAIEINDGQDNQCPGDPGYTLVDEIEGLAGFTDPLDDNAFCWNAQPLALEYEPSRSDAPNQPVNCLRTITAGTCWSDPTLPPPGGIFYYLVRALCGWTGSLGVDSSGGEHVWGCENLFPGCLD